MKAIAEIPVFRFYKEDTGRWYIDLPEWTGDHEALQMVQGADTMLDYVGGGAEEVNLALAEETFEGGNKLVLVHDHSEDIGGGTYFLEVYEDLPVNQHMWLCEVTEWVFGSLPKEIYFKKA